jgi:CDP-diglyceride synthetase
MCPPNKNMQRIRRFFLILFLFIIAIFMDMFFVFMKKAFKREYFPGA